MPRLSISVDDWVYEEILKKSQNRSNLIQEALIKLHFRKKENGESWILSHNHRIMGLFT